MDILNKDTHYLKEHTDSGQKDLAKNDNLSNVIERNINYIEEQLSRTNKGRMI